MNGNFVFLHLSDLHFGDVNETARAKRKNTLDKLLLTLTDLPAEWKPQFIVISGDIGWSGKKNDYDLAGKWLKKLLEILNLQPDDIIPAPGNHDINLAKASGTDVPSDHKNADELLDLDYLKNIAKPFKSFESFCRNMNIPPLTLGTKTSFLAGWREHRGMTWLILNSAWFCRDGRNEKLYIGLPHLDLITAANEWKKRGTPTIGVLHHPPEYLHDEERYCYGRRITYDFLAGECDIILSGHVHGTLIDPDTKYDKAYLFTGGSSYSGERERNNFSIFKCTNSSGTIQRRAYEWEIAHGIWKHNEEYSKMYTVIDHEKKREQDLHRLLFKGSRRHYEVLRGQTGRFRHLEISDIILQEPQKEWIDSTVKEVYDEIESKEGEITGINRKLRYSIPRLWIEGKKHTVLKGDGGMGKTVSLVQLWDELTKQYNSKSPVPVFIQLNEINTVPEEKRMDFVLSAIRKNYFNGQVNEDEIMDFLAKSREFPTAVLLLDGFNEITVDKKELLIQLSKLMEQARGVQVVITSRYDMRKKYYWEHLDLLELTGLEETQIQGYLREKNIQMPEGRLAELVRNPMMLTLYASTYEVQGQNGGDFKTNVETVGELLWNFMEAQAVVFLERLNYDQRVWWFYKFLLKFMLPAMGYEMEKAGLFAFDRETLYRMLDKYCLRFSRSDFFETFADYANYESALQIGACADETAQRERRSHIEEILCNVLFMVVKEGETYRFLHQDFRDYFAALHVLHEAEMGVKRGEVAEVLKERALPVYICRFIGEIEGEHYQRPVFQEGRGWIQEIKRDSLLNRVLDLCRGVFDGSVGYGPWNIVEVWKKVRGELSGSELSKLDLSRVVLNGVHCSRFFGNTYLPASFEGSLLHETSLFPKGHTGVISSAVYSSDWKKILSASGDGKIKEWDVESGQCLKTFIGHEDAVNSAVYSNDWKKILSASRDKKIKEWDVESETCLKTFSGHQDAVMSAVYSQDGKKILSAAEDTKIKEWDVESEQCLKTFSGHEGAVMSAVYSRDGEKILSASEDTKIKEWDVESEQCLKTFSGHEGAVMSAVYRRDGEKILSASEDTKIKEWDVESKQCLKTFSGHERTVMSAAYSRNGEKILSASDDFTIKEWDVESRQCLKTFTGYKPFLKSAIYSRDGNKILSTSDDQTIKEWDVEKGHCLKTFTGHKDCVTNVVYSRDENKILSVSDDRTIKEWDVENGQCLKTFTGHKSCVTSAMYSRDGEKILSSSNDHTIKVWDVENGQCLKTFIGHTNRINSAVYSGDGKKILSASDDRTIKVWDVENGQCLRTFNVHKDYAAIFAYSEDGKKILSASDDHIIKEWDLESGQCLKTFIGHTNRINSAVYSGDGKKILSASNDHTIKEWNVDSEQCIRVFPGHTDWVRSAVYSGDGKKILSASDDHSIKEWHVESNLCLNAMEGIAHNLKVEESPGDAGEKLEKDGNKIEMISYETGKPIRTFRNLPGLFIQGCSFKNLHHGSDLSKESKKFLRQYGGKFE